MPSCGCNSVPSPKNCKKLAPMCTSPSHSHIHGVYEYEGEYTTVGEYADALRIWITKVYNMHCAAAVFPYFLASLQAQNSGSVQTPYQERHSAQPPDRRQATAASATPQQELPRRGVEYYIPPLWKRIIAELIDFFLLFAIKLAFTYSVVDMFDLLSDPDKYDFENIGVDILSDYRKALSMTSEILILECIHRIGTCMFEALCLHRGRGNMGGSTPGKKLFGLHVVRCEWVAPTMENQALVFPATDLGFGRALLRSITKNFSLTFLFPICFTLFSFSHNRTIYDIIAGSMVVERRVIRPQGNRRLQN